METLECRRNHQDLVAEENHDWRRTSGQVLLQTNVGAGDVKTNTGQAVAHSERFFAFRLLRYASEQQNRAWLQSAKPLKTLVAGARDHLNLLFNALRVGDAAG